ncbi:uncharacterized protein LOC142976598 [Anticarsia gemmatalis]|uniref:uncharacterized protein LOC142976598 n=1 Tax=Anticarsia gemmatalis TaxID=129554 RepID=UPI003F76B6D9
MFGNMATASTDEWTEEKCIQLIREYRARPILWDQKDPFFYKNTMKPVAWQEIGDAVSLTADQCKHKMIILMSSFRREKAKIMHSIKNLSDPSQAYKSTWFAFKEMAFLLDKASERKRQLNDSDDMDEEEDSNAANIKLTLLSHHLDAPVQSPKRVKSSKSVTKETCAVTKKRMTAPKREIPSTPPLEPRPGPSQTLSEIDEEIKSFTSFIGNKMKRYTDTTKNAVQQAICDIIFKADQNYFENNSYEKFTIIDVAPDPLSKEIYDEDRTLIKIQNESDSD